MFIHQRPKSRSRMRRGGAVLLTVYMLSVIMLLIVIGNASTTSHQSRDRNRYELYKNEFAAAEMALNQAFGHVQFLVQQNISDLPSKILDAHSPIRERPTAISGLPASAPPDGLTVVWSPSPSARSTRID